MSAHRTLALCLGLAAGIVYLAAHAIGGRQGLVSFVALQARERALTAELAALCAQRDALALRAERLRPEGLDRDYLDERARALLGAARGEEYVFLRPVTNAGL
jgi:cell division protein FtsB